MRLKDRVALVTGSSRGIGAEIARRLAADGAKLVLHARSSPEKVEQVATQIRAAGGSADIVYGDLETAEAPVRIVQEAFAVHGALDILINNAGGGGGGRVHELDLERVDRSLSTNLRAVILATAEFARLTQSPHGRVVLISSGAATHPAFGSTTYAAAKAGAEAFMRSAAQELGERGITLNSVAPGPTVTEMLENSQGQEGRNWGDTAKRWAALRRLGRPDDIADIVAFLCSDDARWLTGTTIPANGGMVTTASNIIAYAR
jgi:3-oxoacyl-[acyl-carrier protein] reductase